MPPARVRAKAANGSRNAVVILNPDARHANMRRTRANARVVRAGHGVIIITAHGLNAPIIADLNNRNRRGRRAI